MIFIFYLWHSPAVGYYGDVELVLLHETQSSVIISKQQSWL